MQDGESVGVALTLVSPAGDQGFPGTLECRVVQRLTAAGELVISYEAEVDAPTVVSLTHHGYWNLAGEGDVLGHEVELCADAFLPVDAEKIPTGERRDVARTSLDLRTPKRLGEPLAAPDAFLRAAGGYDHCFLVRRSGSGLVRAAFVREPKSGRTLELWTTEPGVQLYGGSGLPREPGRGGRQHGPAAGLCLEAQRPPDAPNQPGLGPAILRPGAAYRQETRYRFGVG
jgi:aldose 1-epimerase